MSRTGHVLSRRDVVRTVTRRLLEEPAQRGVWLQRLAGYLVATGRHDQAGIFVNDIAYQLQAQAGVLTAEVVSARQLTQEMRTAIQRSLARQTGAESVMLHETTDQTLLGGFVARTADAEIDASVRTKLKRLAAL